MGKKVKVVFDTNVWLSIFMKKALASDFSNIIGKKATVYVTKEIMTEISKVLMYPRIADILQESGTHPREILRTIATNSVMIEPKEEVHVVVEDPEDNKILECASAAGANIIVSGDKHLLRIGKFRKTKVLTPREFLELFS
jgi:putative PIN family toxin of toxin-antitoxin system